MSVLTVFGFTSATQPESYEPGQVVVVNQSIVLVISQSLSF